MGEGGVRWHGGLIVAFPKRRAGHKEGEGNAARALKALREEAGATLSELAAAIGRKGPSSWQHYENPERFKDEYVPVELARRIAPVFERYGVQRARVMALCDPGAILAPSPAPANDSGHSADRPIVAEIDEIEQRISDLEVRLHNLRKRLRGG